jgi:hypothetical protein
MNRPIDPQKVIASLRLLGLEQAWTQLMQRRPTSLEEAQTLLSTFKVQALKPAYQAFALQHHPDRGGSEEKMKELSEAYNLLKDMTVFRYPRGIRGGPAGGVRRGQPQRVVVVTVNIRGGPATANTSTGPSTSTNTSYIHMDFDGGTRDGL